MEKSNLDKLICIEHKQPITDVCLHPICSLFQPLCATCLSKHMEYHNKNKLNNEPEPKNVMTSLKDLRQRIYQTLIKARNDMEQLQDAIYQEISLSSDPETNIEQIIQELQSIKVTIMHEFDSFIGNLRIQFETPIKEKLNLISDGIKQKLDQILDLIPKIDTIDTLRIISQNDINYMVHMQKIQMDQVINQRKQQRFQGVIDDDSCLRFIGAFQKELNNLIVYKPTQQQIAGFYSKYRSSVINNPNNPNNPNPNILNPNGKINLMLRASSQQMMLPGGPSSFLNQQQLQANLGDSLIDSVKPNKAQLTANKKHDKTKKSVYLDASVISNLVETRKFNTMVFYFEPKTKFFHFLDLSSPPGSNQGANGGVGRRFEKIELKIPFVIPENHRAILAGDGKIYLIGGYDYSQVSEENEDQYHTIWQLDFDRKTLIQQQNFSLLTLRHSFGVCCLDNEIYVVGGCNYREGTLDKCEKIDCLEKRVLPINSLKRRSSHCSLVAYKNKYIFKLGGIFQEAILDKNRVSRTLHDSILECYSLDTDMWAEVVEKNVVDVTFKQFYLGQGIQINENNIYVFGGLNEQGDPLSQAFLIEIIESQEDFIEKNIFQIYPNTEQLQYPAIGMCLDQPCFYNNKIHQIFYYEDRAHIGTFKLKWQVLQ